MAREEMKRQARSKRWFWLALLLSPPIAWGSAYSQVPSEGVRVSFYGYQSTPVGYFDETEHTGVVLWTGGTLGPFFQGSSYYFGFLSRGHENLGYTGLEDTRVDCPEFPCTDCDYRMYASFVGPSGEVMIGGVSGGCCDQAAQLVGEAWAGLTPYDFTHIYITVDAHEPLNICPREFLLPITWAEDPVPVAETTWGHVKALYE